MGKWDSQKIQERFDKAAEVFWELGGVQPEIVDGERMLRLVAYAAARCCPDAKRILDLGCGTGLYSGKVLELLPNREVTLLDLSSKMLGFAKQRIEAQTSVAPTLVQGDVRELELPAEHFDIVLSGAALHHLREDSEWESTFQKMYNTLKPGGCFWIADLVSFSLPGVRELMDQLYQRFLTELGGDEFSKMVLEGVEVEDTPRPLAYQLELLKGVGFSEIEVLHHSICFAAFGASK